MGGRPGGRRLRPPSRDGRVAPPCGRVTSPRAARHIRHAAATLAAVWEGVWREAGQYEQFLATPPSTTLETWRARVQTAPTGPPATVARHSLVTVTSTSRTKRHLAASETRQTSDRGQNRGPGQQPPQPAPPQPRARPTAAPGHPPATGRGHPCGRPYPTRLQTTPVTRKSVRSLIHSAAPPSGTAADTSSSSAPNGICACSTA